MGVPLIFEIWRRPVTSCVVCVCTAVWFQIQKRGITYADVGISYELLVQQRQWWRILTAALSHISPIHLIFNMSALWSLGVLESSFSSPALLPPTTPLHSASSSSSLLSLSSSSSSFEAASPRSLTLPDRERPAPQASQAMGMQMHMKMQMHDLNPTAAAAAAASAGGNTSGSIGWISEAATATAPNISAATDSVARRLLVGAAAAPSAAADSVGAAAAGGGSATHAVFSPSWIGAADYARDSVIILVLSALLMILIYHVLVVRLRLERYRHVTAVGYSGVVFGLMALLSSQQPSSSLTVFGVISLPASFAPFESLVLTSLIVPQASFVGHLAGILVGYVVAAGAFEGITPYWTFVLLFWLTIGFLYSLKQTGPLNMSFLVIEPVASSAAPSDLDLRPMNARALDQGGGGTRGGADGGSDRTDDDTPLLLVPREDELV